MTPEGFSQRFLRWKKDISRRKTFILLSFGFLAFAALCNNLASSYADRVSDYSETDLILDNIPAVNLVYLMVYGYVAILVLLFSYPLFFKVKSFHEVVFQASFLIITRNLYLVIYKFNDLAAESQGF
jgi:hypothetical protein